MTANNSDNDLFFAPEDDTNNETTEKLPTWRLLIVDDEPGIHEVTSMALGNFELDNRQLEFLHAYSGEEARKILQQEDDIAVALVDVVMETEHAGLDLIHYIRNELKNQMIRLILRTGQPGQAPERKVIMNYDINDYKEKSELSAQKLFSTVLTSLRSYRDLQALDANRKGLEQVIKASGEVFRSQMLRGFIQGVLKQLIALLYLDNDSMYGACDSLAIENSEDKISIIAATGSFSSLVGQDAKSCLPKKVMKAIQKALDQKTMVVDDNVYVGYFEPRPGREDIIYITSQRQLSEDDSNLIKLFLHNVSIAYENAILRDDIEGTQRDMVYMLGEAIETRSKETGNHVRRVAEYSYVIAKGLGLSDRESEILRIAAPLHDFGKIGIPDAILHKPGRLETDEFETMKTHAQVGEELLGRSDREILKAAAILAGDHHEKWDGSGYPKGKKGEEIHLYGRIVAVADVFDALGSKRAYKEAWPVENITEFLNDNKGTHFDPTIVDWVLINLTQMVAIRSEFPDPDD